MRYGRKAFGPGRKRSVEALAKDIVASIRSHQAGGVHRGPEQYTTKPETLTLVRQYLQAAYMSKALG